MNQLDRRGLSFGVLIIHVFCLGLLLRFRNFH